MPSTALEAVIRVEQEVQARIAAEQKNADIWVQEQKNALTKHFAAEQSALHAESEQKIGSMRRECEAKAAEYRRQAEELVLFMENVDDAVVTKLVRQVIITTIPGFDP